MVSVHRRESLLRGFYFHIYCQTSLPQKTSLVCFEPGSVVAVDGSFKQFRDPFELLVCESRQIAVPGEFGMIEHSQFFAEQLKSAV